MPCRTSRLAIQVNMSMVGSHVSNGEKGISESALSNHGHLQCQRRRHWQLDVTSSALDAEFRTAVSRLGCGGELIPRMLGCVTEGKT
jgi:hypothetical protein